MSNKVNISRTFKLKCPKDKKIQINNIRVSDSGRCDSDKIGHNVMRQCHGKKKCKLSNDIIGCPYDMGVNYGCIDDIGKKLDGSNEMIHQIDSKQELKLDLLSDGDQEDIQELKTTQSIKLSEEATSEDMDIVENQELSGDSTLTMEDNQETEQVEDIVVGEENTPSLWDYKNWFLGVSVFLLLILAIYIFFTWLRKDKEDEIYLDS